MKTFFIENTTGNNQHELYFLTILLINVFHQIKYTLVTTDKI